MFLEINLLTRSLKISASFKKTISVLNRISLILLILFIVLISTIFYLRLTVKQTADNIAARFNSAKTRIESAKPTESLFFAFTSKISTIDKLLVSRTDPVLLINEVKKSLPKDTQLISLNYSKEGISFTITTDKYENIELLIYSLKNNVTVAFESITLQSLERKGNNYDSKLGINMISKTVKQ